jgi:V-type H+-transporting ATPase subunit H
MLLDRANNDLDNVFSNEANAQAFCSILLKMIQNNDSPQKDALQGYVFGMTERILGLNIELDSAFFGPQNAKYFTVGDVPQIEGFKNALKSTNSNIRRSSSICLACLLSKCPCTETDRFTEFILQHVGGATVAPLEDYITASLCIILRSERARELFISRGGVTHLTNFITMIGPNGSAQQLYDYTFCLWALSLSSKSCIESFIAGTVRALVELAAAAPSRKIFRVTISALRNLAASENDSILTEMLTHGLQRTLEQSITSNAHKQAGDIDVEADVRFLFELLTKNFRELSKFDRWEQEIRTGDLRWGILHTEKFWRENCKFLERDNFALLKTLTALLDSSDSKNVSIALYDIGEFTRFYPNGRGIARDLGAKEKAMNRMNDPNPDIQRHALQCVSKIMVTNWEFMR